MTLSPTSRQILGPDLLIPSGAHSVPDPRAHHKLSDRRSAPRTTALFTPQQPRHRPPHEHRIDHFVYGRLRDSASVFEPEFLLHESLTARIGTQPFSPWVKPHLAPGCRYSPGVNRLRDKSIRSSQPLGHLDFLPVPSPSFAGAKSAVPGPNVEGPVDAETRVQRHRW